MDHLKDRLERVWLKTIQKPDTNMSGNQMVPVFECPVFKWLLYWGVRGILE
jgi:hypothetical protein